MQSYLVTTVFPLSGRTCITIYGLDSGGRQRGRDTNVRHNRTAGEQSQKFTPLGVASGAPGELLYTTWTCAARGWVGAEGTGEPKGPADMDGSMVAVGVAAVVTAVVATAVAVASVAPASAGAAAAREGPVSKTSDVGCVGRSAVGVGGIGGAVGDALRGGGEGGGGEGGNGGRGSGGGTSLGAIRG